MYLLSCNFFHFYVEVKLTSVSSDAASEQGSVNDDGTPTVDRRVVRFLSKENSFSADDKPLLLEKIMTLAEENAV